MIAWSYTKLKFTSGIGTLGTTALLADISHEKLPIWLVMVASLFPFTVFLFIRPDEMRRSIVLPLQALASIWYLSLSLILSVLFFQLQVRERGWPILFASMMVGTIPCVVVLWTWLRPKGSD